MSKKVLLSLVLCFAVNASSLGRVYATEIVIEGNGGGSDNQVQVTSTTETTVTQENNAEVSNNVENNANTGGNEANSNNGNTNIQTGNAENSTTVNNENINSNSAEAGPCNCEQDTTIKISGNGTGSNNTVYGGVSNTSTVNQTNNATIKNNITVKANTGYNTANYNTGNATIKTGNITSSVVVNNKNINNSYASVALPTLTANVVIAGNGAHSDNIAYLNIQKSLVTNNTNNADILNNVFTFLNTGGNKANGNTGDVAILTGDIISNILINNENINSNFVHADCECENPENPQPTPTITPPPPPGKCTDNCNPTNGSVGGASASSGGGEVLPATGSYFLYLITLASLITFFMGWYLRFRSGVAPGK